MTGILNLLMGTVRSAGVTADPYFEYTTLLLPGSGTNGAQNNTFLDSGTANGGVGFPITRNPLTGPNAPTQGTFSPFSQTGWGNYFSGSNSVTSASLGTAIGTSDFSLEFFIYQTASAGIITPLVLNMAGNNIYLQTNSGAARFLSDSGIAVLSGGTVNTNTWNHLVATRQGSTVRLFVNGVLVANTTSSTSFGTPTATIGGATTLYLASTRVCIGSVPTSYQTSSTTNGTTIFTPPTSLLTTSSQGATAADVKLLTCQSNRFIDISDSPKTLTTSGSPTVVAFSPFNPTASWSAATNGGSGYFDGNGDYLTAPDNTAFTLGSSDFCIELWINPSSSMAQFAGFLGQWANSPTDCSFVFRTQFSQIVQFAYTTNGSGQAGTSVNGSALTANSWNHLVVCRSGANLAIFQNGTRTATHNISTLSISDSSRSVQIGFSTDGGYVTGYLSDLRLVKGSSVYDPTQTTITVPTAPLTAITNTSLLLNFTNAGIYDATSKNDLETVGDAQISNTTAKWGSTSIKFDGTGDYLQMPDSELVEFGSADFTIEAWVYPTLITGANRVILGHGTSGTQWLAFYIDANGYLTFAAVSSSAVIDRTATSRAVSLNTWTHVAVSRSGSTFRLFIDGSEPTYTGSPSTTSSAMPNFAAPFRIGAQRWDGDSGIFQGYIQDLRITKGYARYTANFTTPTAAFPTL